MTKVIPDAKRRWNVYWRQQRIIRRETSKACMDAMFFGIGFTVIGYDVPDFIAHIEPNAIFNGRPLKTRMNLLEELKQ